MSMADEPVRRLTHDEIVKIATSNEPFVKIIVLEGDETEKLLYIDTWRQELLYDPKTFSLSASSNKSVVLRLEMLEQDKYTISNTVIPSAYLTTGNSQVSEESVTLLNIAFNNLSNELDITKFYKEPAGQNQDEKVFALYTELHGEKYYLIPRVRSVYDANGQIIGSRNTILAEQEHVRQRKFVFSCTEVSSNVQQSPKAGSSDQENV